MSGNSHSARPVLGGHQPEVGKSSEGAKQTQAAWLLGQGSGALTPGKGKQAQVGVGRWRRAAGEALALWSERPSALHVPAWVTLGKSVYLWSLGFLS